MGVLIKGPQELGDLGPITMLLKRLPLLPLSALISA